MLSLLCPEVSSLLVLEMEQADYNYEILYESILLSYMYLMLYSMVSIQKRQYSPMCRTLYG
jgi:hypothetical protein